MKTYHIYLDDNKCLFKNKGRNYIQKASLKKSLELEISRLKKYENKSDYLSYLRHSYVQQGLYAQMINRYLQYFSLDNFLFIHFEDELLQERELTIKRILEFLEIDSSVSLRTDIRSNPSSKEKSKYFKKLIIFRPHNVYGKNMGEDHVIPEFISRFKSLKGKKFKIHFLLFFTFTVATHSHY